MDYMTLFRTIAVALLLAPIACSGTPQSPTSPTDAPFDLTEASPGEATLKATPPRLVSPINNQRLDNRKPTLVIDNSQGLYVPATFSYEFQVMNQQGNLVHTQVVNQQQNRTRFDFPYELQWDRPYRWRARAMLDGAIGPWSGVGAFRTVAVPPCPPKIAAPRIRGGTPVEFGTVVAVAAKSAHWARCQQGSGLSCHLFTREVANVLHRKDRNWGMLTKNPGEWGCTATRCGSNLTCHLGEDIIMYKDTQRLVDIILGAGAPGARLSWQALGLHLRRRHNFWTPPPPM